jgi:hypothetical protein
MQKITDTQDKYRDSIEDSLGFLDTISNTINEIPVIGGVLNKALGVDELKEKLGEQKEGLLRVQDDITKLIQENP